MIYRIKRTSEEIDDLLDQVMERVDRGTKYPGQSYEEGLRAMFDWLTEDKPEYDPME